MIDTDNLNEARKLIEAEAKQGKPVVRGKSIDFNRIILENKKVGMLILDHRDKKDKLKQRDSGLNHVLAEIARKNNITLAFDIDEFKIEDKKEKAKILSRWIHNIKLAKKAGNKIRLLNYKDKKEAFSFLTSLGLDTKKAEEAL